MWRRPSGEPRGPEEWEGCEFIIGVGHASSDWGPKEQGVDEPERPFPFGFAPPDPEANARRAKNDTLEVIRTLAVGMEQPELDRLARYCGRLVKERAKAGPDSAQSAPDNARRK